MIISGIIASSVRIPISATGGTKTLYNNYFVHTITGSTTFTVSEGYDFVEYDFVASGGGGGSDHNGAGGGGAGGRITGRFLAFAGNYTVVFGAAGTGGPSHFAPGTSASNSTLTGNGISITAIGGGRGGAYANAGFSGGCGGGGGFYQPGGTGLQGFNGGNGQWYSGGGGGGLSSAGGVASPANTYPAVSGNGGNGRNIPDSSWLASVVSRGGGGGGGGGDYGGSSSSGGGIGRGVLDSPYNGGNGLANYGGGGGGGRDSGGNGGSGILYIRYRATY